MIDCWRNSWHKEFPFYYVQIAPYKYGGENEGALLQEQQTKTMIHPKTGMVVITDLIDSVTNIHPSDKRLVGRQDLPAGRWPKHMAKTWANIKSINEQGRS